MVNLFLHYNAYPIFDYPIFSQTLPRKGLNTYSINQQKWEQKNITVK